VKRLTPWLISHCWFHVQAKILENVQKLTNVMRDCTPRGRKTRLFLRDSNYLVVLWEPVIICTFLECYPWNFWLSFFSNITWAAFNKSNFFLIFSRFVCALFVRVLYNGWVRLPVNKCKKKTSFPKILASTTLPSFRFTSAVNCRA
jgi:hypothetical protein